MARGIAAGVWLLATVLLLIYGTASASTDFGQRYALVIGNSSYTEVEQLPNTASDAIAMADALEALRFTVFRGIDLDREQFERLIAEFRTASADADAVVFYYAGHGFQLSGRNHLVPVDAVLRDRSRIDAETFVLDDIVERIRRPGRPTIVLLDACRDNPLPPGVQDGTGAGLAQLQTGDDTLIAFATQPGNVSYDGTSDHSPFTEALLTHIGAPQQTIFDLMINVRNEVSNRTLDRQVPWVQFSLRESFSFNPTPQSVARTEPGELAGNQQGLIISRGVPDGRNTDTAEAEPSQAAPNATPAAPATVGPRRPRFQFGPRPDASQQAGSPPESLPQPAEEEVATQPVRPDEPEAGLAQDIETEDTEAVSHAEAVSDVEAVSPAATQPESARLAATQELRPAGSSDEPEVSRSADADPEPQDAPDDAREGEQQVAALPSSDGASAQPAADSEQETSETSGAPEAEQQIAALPGTDSAPAQPALGSEQETSEASGEPEAEEQIAALPRDELEPEPEPEAPLIDGEELVRLIQENLQRLGCYRLGIDGDWGPGSRNGLENFYRETGQEGESLDPSLDVLARLEQESGEICPPPKVKSPPKKTRVTAPAPKAPAPSTPQRARQQPAPQPTPSQKRPPKLLF